MTNKRKVLIIDDEVDLCLLLKTYLARKNYEVYFSHSLVDGLKKFNEIDPDILFLDNNLPDGLGWDKAKTLLEKNPDLQLHLISAYHPKAPDLTSNSLKVWEKPLTLKELDNFLQLH